MSDTIIYHGIQGHSETGQVVVVRVTRENGKQVSSVPVAWHKNQTLALTDMHARNAIEWDKSNRG